MSELIFEGVTLTPTDPGSADAEGAKNELAESQKEAGEKAPGHTGQDGQVKVQEDTASGMEFQAVPSEKPEVGQALGLPTREEDCFQILGRPGKEGAGAAWAGG